MTQYDNHNLQNGNLPVQPFEIVRFTPDHPIAKEVDQVVIEQPITIMIDQVGSFTIMCAPCEIEALAVGFIYTEGMIDGIDDIIAISSKKELPNVIGIKVHDPTRISIQRNLIIASSCGMCGTRNIDKMLSEMPPCHKSLQVDTHLLSEMMEKMQNRQKIFQLTGGSHAAGIFTSTGEIIALSEDIGRHSALDKAIGKCLINKKDARGCGVTLSGRASLELISKAARAGIEIIAAVSAPSSYAIEAAERWNITLCGFVRSGKMNAYTHPNRICDYQAV